MKRPPQLEKSGCLHSLFSCQRHVHALHLCRQAQVALPLHALLQPDYNLTSYAYTYTYTYVYFCIFVL